MICSFTKEICKDDVNKLGVRISDRGTSKDEVLIKRGKKVAMLMFISTNEHLSISLDMHGIQDFNKEGTKLNLRHDDILTFCNPN